ncbi:MFS transporter [Pseudomonas sp. TH34]|uniref:MFS transporter n=1 Tax=Pseudomonas sp. TH34 TaxID=2796399 RepID=UPI0019121AA0|nr:MFS transporter [Pseudomonas sp. TH34]MBK5410854.1 MFS transporter [Pseudomonas sp. TH34]
MLPSSKTQHQLLAQADTASTWSAVCTVGVGAFALVTTEFLPVGLLPNIARDLEISDGQAGLMITIPGVLAAISAPLTLAIAGRIDRRRVLLALVGLLALSNLMVAYAGDMYLLLAGRVLLGVAVGGFWTVAGALGPRMRPGKDAGRATAIILSGISLGTVAGVPVGTLAGHLVGWREVFIAASVIALLVVGALAVLLPHLPANGSTGIAQAFDALSNRRVQVGLLVVGLVFIGQFAAYTYITPFLNSVPKVSASQLSAVLLGYGLAGFLGNLFGGWAVTHTIKGVFVATAMLIGIGVSLLLLLGASPVLAIAAVMAWGLGFGMLPVAAQTLMLNIDTSRAEGLSALLVFVLQAAIGAGALVGGLALDDLGVFGPLGVGAAAALMSAGLAFIYHRTT